MSTVVLFDIDGTLIRCGDAPRKALGRAMTEVFGGAGRLSGVKFGGKTDRIIVRESLDNAPPWGDSAWDVFWQRYAATLASELEAAPPLVLPGVVGLLDALASRRDVRLGIVTGNVAAGARAKLRASHLDSYFPDDAIAAYGSEGEIKSDLGPVAARRCLAISPEARRVIVGDTHSDIACAKAGGFIAIAVATGPQPLEELSAHGPDFLLPSFEPLERTLGVLLG